MKKTLSVPGVSLFVVLALSAMICFHVCILTGIVPFQNVWGGRLKTREEMQTFEITAIAISILMITVAAIKAGFLRLKISKKVLAACLVAMGGFFLLNSLGNLAAVNAWERFIFTPITLLLSASCFFLAFTKTAA